MPNIRYYMLQEQMGIGPSKYCVVGPYVRGLESLVLLLLNYLPQGKICTYPIRLILRGPFLQPLWADRGKEISMRGVKIDELDVPNTWATSPSGDMVCIRLTTQARLTNNIRLALFKEAVGLGPKRYCVVYSRSPAFYAQFGLLIGLLPRHKMFLYPFTQIGIVGQEPWVSRAREVCSHPTITPAEFLLIFGPRG